MSRLRNCLLLLTLCSLAPLASHQASAQERAVTTTAPDAIDRDDGFDAGWLGLLGLLGLAGLAGRANRNHVATQRTNVRDDAVAHR